MSPRTSSELLYATLLSGMFLSHGSGVVENRVKRNMIAGNKTAPALSDGISDETGQVVQLQSRLHSWEILSCERWHALIRISTAILTSK